MKLYMGVGCSQEDHLPNCGHFGESGAYLSDHAAYCESAKLKPCTCNPTARKKAAEQEAKDWVIKHHPDAWQSGGGFIWQRKKGYMDKHPMIEPLGMTWKSAKKELLKREAEDEELRKEGLL